MTRSTPESVVLNAICEYLSYKGYFFFRVNNVGVYDVAKQIHRKQPKWSVKGVSDIIMVYNGHTYFIEVKAPRGKQSPHQEAFEGMVEENGCDYILARSVNDVQAYGI